MNVKFRRIRDREQPRSTYYLQVSQGLAPPPVKLSPRTSAIPEHEDELMNAAALAGLSDDERRELVRQLVDIRPQFLAGRGDAAIARIREQFVSGKEAV